MPRWVFSSWPSYISPLIASWVGDAALTVRATRECVNQREMSTTPRGFHPMGKGARRPRASLRFAIIGRLCSPSAGFFQSDKRLSPREPPWITPRRTSPSVTEGDVLLGVIQGGSRGDRRLSDWKNPALGEQSLPIIAKRSDARGRLAPFPIG